MDDAAPAPAPAALHPAPPAALMEGSAVITSVDADATFSALQSTLVRPRRERRPAADQTLLASPKTRPIAAGTATNTAAAVAAAAAAASTTRGTRGRPRGRPPRRGGGRQLGRNAPAPDDASETSDTSRGPPPVKKAYDPSKMEHGDELYCICRKPYQADKFMIGCDRCDGWFHPECVNITTQQAQRAQSYTCPKCNADGVVVKKKRKRSVLTLASTLPANSSYSAIMSPETMKRRMAVVRELASRLSDEMVTGPPAPDIDTDVDISSDDNDARTLDVRGEAEDDVFCFDHIDGSDPEQRDYEIIGSMKRSRVDCEVSLQAVRVYQGLIAGAVAFARRQSLEQRFDELARTDVEICLRLDPYSDQRVPPALVSGLCLSCKGDVPMANLQEHLEACVAFGPDVPFVRGLAHSVVHSRHHHLDDMWLEEDDREGEAPLLICAYPFALADMNLEVAAVPTVPELKFCMQSRTDCIEHSIWQQLASAELTQREHILRRRARRLDIELIDISRRLHERQKHVAHCRRESIAPGALGAAHPTLSMDPSSVDAAAISQSFQERAAAAAAAVVSQSFQERAASMQLSSAAPSPTA